MRPDLQQTLFEISTYHHPEPQQVFHRLVTAVAEHHPGTMAMINLVDEDRIRFRAVVNPHAQLAGLDALALADTY